MPQPWNMTRDALEKEVIALRQLLVDADYVARARTHEYGICDAIDNNGRPYPSQWSADLIEVAKETTVVSDSVAGRAG